MTALLVVAALLLLCIATVVCNIGILWIVIKLYTEIMKILNFNAKKKEDIKP